MSIKVISKEYGSKSEATFKILKETQEVVIPHMIYLSDFLVNERTVSFKVGYDKYLSDGNNNFLINSEKTCIKHRNEVNLQLKLSEKSFILTQNGDWISLSKFSTVISEEFGDSKKLALCNGLIKYAEFLQEQLWEIENMDNKIDVFKKTMAKKELIVEKND